MISENCILIMLKLKKNKVLPEEVVISSVDDLLYEIGLCLTSVRERPKRRAIDSPVVIAVFNLVYLIQRITSITFECNHDQLLYLGDFGHYLGSKHYNLMLIVGGLIVMTSQLNYYYNYKRGIKPTFVRVFQMMSGLVTPNSVGLYREENIKRIMKYKKIIEILIKNNRTILPILAFIFPLTMFSLNESFIDILLYGLPNSLFQSLVSYYTANIIFIQTIYLLLICKYLESKIKNLNERVIQMQRK